MFLCISISACSTNGDDKTTNNTTSILNNDTFKNQPMIKNKAEKHQSIVTHAKDKSPSFETTKSNNFTEHKSTQMTVHFDYDNALLSIDTIEILKTHAKYLNKNTKSTLLIAGHTDRRGTPEYNIALSERRAKSVKKHFNNMGVAESRLSIVSYGEEKLAANGHNDKAHKANRRAQLSYD
jgi:peptidoglycan-associated lipoprotein